jgi:HSP20 family protein
MTQSAVHARERDRIPDVVELLRRFARMAELPAFLAEELRVDIEENEREFQVRAEIPGVRKEDVQVSVDGCVLTIHTRIVEPRHDPKAQDGHRSLVAELRRGSLSRTVHLPHEIEEKKVHAKLENGILSLTCPKRVSGKQTLVAIQ